MRVTPGHIRAHRHCSRHRDEVLWSETCGCFYCIHIFAPSEIMGWVDAWENGAGQTARCPRCGIDSVIGSASGYPINAEFLGDMRAFWFGPSLRRAARPTIDQSEAQMNNGSTDIIQFPGPPELQKQLEDGAARLNLTVAAYVEFLLARQSSSVGPKRFDRMAKEVFGRYGQVMRNLAK